MCDVPLHIHIKRQKDRKISDINVRTADTNEQSLATCTRAGKQNLLVDRWVSLKVVKLIYVLTGPVHEVGL